jgi:hypothetical protein
MASVFERYLAFLAPVFKFQCLFSTATPIFDKLFSNVIARFLTSKLGVTPIFNHYEHCPAFSVPGMRFHRTLAAAVLNDLCRFQALALVFKFQRLFSTATPVFNK